MALYQQYSWVSQSQFLTDLGSFATTNGWAIVGQDASTIELSKGLTRFKAYKYSTSTIYFYIYSGGAYSTQVVSWAHGVSGGPYYFISAGQNIFLSLMDPSYGYYIGMIGTITDKIGNWTGGAFAHLANYNSSLFLCRDIANSAGRAIFYFNGAWTPTGNVVGRVAGGVDYYARIRDCNVNTFNGAITLFKCPIYVVGPSDGQYRPVGFAPDIYVTNFDYLCGDGEILTIGSDQYLAWCRGNYSYHFFVKIS